MNFTESNEKNSFILLLCLCSCFIILPFFFVHFVPVTDIPQQLAQIRLAGEIIKNDSLHTEYSLNTYGANSLVYALIGAHWLVFEPITAGKAVVLELALLWMFSLFAFAHRTQCSPFIAALCSVLIFNTSFYWGFINFLIGWPVFILWYVFVIDSEQRRSPLMDIAITLSIGFLLFCAHALWLPIGVLMLILGNIFRARPLRKWLIHCGGLFPIGVWSIIWFLAFASARKRLSFDTTPFWRTSFFERLDPAWLVNSILGGIRGSYELFVCLGILLWIVLSIKTNWGTLRKELRIEFILIAAIFLCLVFFTPEEFMNTIFFAQRWTPFALTFVLFALPPPRIPEPWKLGGITLLLAFFSTATAWTWVQFEKNENDGLAESLLRLTPNPAVVGLDFIHESKYICGYPFLQSFAYAQVLHGGTLNFTFAEHNSGIVVLDPERKKKRPWTEGLEWYPEWITPQDLKYFDYALIHATQIHHDLFAAKPELSPVTTDGSWRLYRCRKDSGTARSF